MEDWEKGVLETILDKISNSKKRRNLGTLTVIERGDNIFESSLSDLPPVTLYLVCYWQEIARRRKEMKAVHEGHHRSSGVSACDEGFCTCILAVIDSMLFAEVYYQESATRAVIYDGFLQPEFALTISVEEHKVDEFTPHCTTNFQQKRPKFQLIHGGLSS